MRAPVWAHNGHIIAQDGPHKYGASSKNGSSQKKQQYRQAGATAVSYLINKTVARSLRSKQTVRKYAISQEIA